MPTTWIMYPNAHRDNGIAIGAYKLKECRSSCFKDRQCTSIDWVAGAPGGEQCWHHRGIPLDKITPSAGTTHYEVRKMAYTWWQKYSNEDSNTAGTAIAADDLDSCKEWCATNGTACNVIGWNPNAAQGQKCLFHLYIIKPVKQSASVTLYKLTRGMDGHCGK